MDAPDHILIVDDDAEIRSLLGQYLVKNGLRATAVADGRAMWQALDAGRIDLVVLDLMLPGDDGLTLCRNLRAKSDVPVIMLTARGEETDRIVGLEMGADDYLAKPFSARELLARIKAILRRARSLPDNLQPDSARRLRFGEWVLDTAQRQLVSAAGVVTALSGAEYRLLRIFLGHPNRVLNRDQLVDLTQGKEADPLDRSIDVQVSRLRHRLGDDPRDPRLIKTVRGEGYVLAVDVAGGALMRLLPRSLFGRLLLVLSAGLIVAQLLSATINLAERDRVLVRASGMQPAQRIADIVALLDSLNSAERDRIVGILSAPPMIVTLDRAPEGEGSATTGGMHADDVRDRAARRARRRPAGARCRPRCAARMGARRAGAGAVLAAGRPGRGAGVGRAGPARGTWAR